jgi:hypothetical protein
LESPVTPVQPVATLDALKKRFSESRELSSDARRESEIDIDYNDGYQWTPTERRALQQRKQPDLVFNRVRPAVAGMLGVLKQGKTDPKAWGRAPDDDDAADVATKVLRFIGDRSDFHNIRMDVASDYLRPGIGACIIEGTKDGKVPIIQIRWEEFFYDPRSRRADFKDARYMGVAKWMYTDQVAKLYPEKKEGLLASIDGTMMLADQSYNDRPMAGSGSWYDKKYSRVMVVEMYHNDGGWQRSVFYAGEVLESGASPYLDEDKKASNPIEAQSCFVDRENNRYGVIRDMRGPQDEVNKRRSKLLHILNNRQVVAKSEMALNVDANAVRDEAARPDGVIPAGWEPVTLTDMATGQMQLLQEAKAEIERQAPNPAILGRLGNSESGRAQLVRQQSGMTELAVVFGGIENWELRVYRQMWARAKQFWTAADYVRVTDDRGSPEFIGINQPVHGPAQIGMHPQTGMAMIHKPVLGYKNTLAEMDVDITLDITPHAANVEQEQFQALVDLRRSGVPIDPMLLIECSSLPNKSQIIEKMQQQQQEQSQQPNPEQQMAMQEGQSKIALNQAGAAHKNALAQLVAIESHNAAHEPVRDMFHAGVQAGQAQAEGQRADAQAMAAHKIKQQEADVRSLVGLNQFNQKQDAAQGN